MTQTATRMLPDPPRAVDSQGGRAPVVFLGLPMAINVRDVLRTDAFRTPRDAVTEIHLFSAAADVAEFRAEFEAVPTVVEGS